VPSDAVITIDPPVWTVLKPEVTNTLPAEFEFPLPTVSLNNPPVPPLEAPDCKSKKPVLPEEDVPDLNWITPEIPSVPALAEAT
jgi:hypothetical protein